MSDRDPKVVAFPVKETTASELAQARQRDPMRADVGDLVCVCNDAKADLWVFFIVAYADDEGTVCSVGLEDGTILHLAKVAERQEILIWPISKVREGCRPLLWTPFLGLPAAKAALDEWRVK